MDSLVICLFWSTICSLDIGMLMTVAVVLPFSMLKTIAKHECNTAYFNIWVFSVSLLQCCFWQSCANIPVQEFKRQRPRSEIEYDYVEPQLVIPNYLSKMVIYIYLQYIFLYFIYLYSHKQWIHGPLAPHPRPYLFFMSSW